MKPTSQASQSAPALPEILANLRPKHRRFVEEYLVDLCATQAAIRAGYSKNTAQEQSSRLLSKAIISRAVTQLRQKAAQDLGITRERWLRELACCAFFDVRKLFDQFGNPIEIPALDAETRCAIAGFEFVEEFIGKKDETRTAVGYTKKFKLVDRLRALELYGKAMGYYTEKRELSGTMTLEQLVAGEDR